MKIQNSIKAAVAAFLIGAAAQASATVVKLDASGLPTYLNNNTYQGSFNGSALLPANFIINKVGFSFSFSDDGDDLSTVSGAPVKTTGTPVTVAVGTGGDKSVTTPVTITTKVTRTDPLQEIVQLSLGSVSRTGQTTKSVTDLTVSHTDDPVLESTTYTKNGGKTSCTAAEAAANNSSCKATYTYTVTTHVTNTTTTDYTGDIALTGFLPANDSVLAVLMSTRSLNFGLNVTGDLNLTNASLTVDYTETPEPGTLALFGIALMGVAGLRRARRG